jgi:hypothetical protein
MKLTSFGFVSRSEELLKEALSLPPVGGGTWCTRRVTNLIDHSSSLHVSVISLGGSEKNALILHSRLTGGARDGSIQGWAEYPSSGEREAFILREADADRAMEEIFEIVEKTLMRVPEWDQSALPPRPEPIPRSFEPLIPSIQKSEPAPAPAVEAEAFDPQAMVDAMLSTDSFEELPSSPVAEQEPAAAEETLEPPAIEKPTLEPAAENDSKVKKTSKAKKPKS